MKVSKTENRFKIGFQEQETGVTGQNILPAGVYPGILWPRPIYTPGHILAQANSYPPRPQYTPGYKLAQAINMPGYNLAWAALTPDIIRAASNLSRLNAD